MRGEGQSRDRGAELESIEDSLIRLMIVRRQPAYRQLLAAGTGLEGRIATMRTLRAISALSERGSAPSVREVAERLGIEQSNTSRAVDYAVQRGFVVKIQSADDGRRLELTLTDLGASVISDLDTRRNEIHREMLSNWSNEDVRQLATLLEKLLTAYDDLT
jgi:DNA-binding MarR family transcriptional regulator